MFLLALFFILFWFSLGAFLFKNKQKAISMRGSSILSLDQQNLNRLKVSFSTI
jgi:hypothetical protein